MGDNNEIEQPTVTVSMPPFDEQSQPPDDSDRKHMDCSVPAFICLCCVGILLFIIIVPIYLIYALAAFLLCNKDVTTGTIDESEDGYKGIFQQMRDLRGAAYHMVRAVPIVHSRIMIGLLTWLIINLSIKSLRRKIILGSHLWQWTLVVAVASCGYPVINMLMTLTLHYFTKMYKNRMDAVYFVRGLKTSFNLITFSIVLFLTWDFYFSSHKGLSHAAPHSRVPYLLLVFKPPPLKSTHPLKVLRPHPHLSCARTTQMRPPLKFPTSSSLIVAIRPHRWELASAIQSFHRKTSNTHLLFHIVRGTLVSLVIFSICWLFKNALLLKWEAHTIYNRFSRRILRAGFQFYILAVISGALDLFKPIKMGEMVKNGKKENGEKTILTNERGLVENTAMDDVQKRKKEESEEEKRQDKDSKHLKHERSVERKPSIEKVEEEKTKREREPEKRIVQDMKDRMLSKDLTTYKIKRMAKPFITLARLSSRDEEDDICDILEYFHEKFPKDHGCIIEDNLREFLEVDEEEAKFLYAELQGGHPSAQVSYETFEKWMVRAHKNCLALGYTLVVAKEVAEWLNIFMTLSVVVITIISLLLLTGIATTKLLILLTSPLLAATYIFSDSFKTFLDGVIFVYVRHVFDVGDQCLIDGSEMEVKCISILTTTFLKKSGGEEVIYPNSILGTKTIVHLKGERELGPNDYIELNLDPTTKLSKISELRKRIKRHINGVYSAQDDDEDDDIYCRIVVKEIGNVIKMGVHFKYEMTILDVARSHCLKTKDKQRSKLLLKIKEILEDLEIKTV
ncbi:hypothetical protein Ancab_012430 [Ancistrocladus abbreviatus]